MSVEILLNYVGILGIGGILGIIIKSFFEKKLSDKKMMFEARIKAYSGITGRIFNLFLEPDITILKEDALIWARLNQLLSEAMLMASHDLSELLGEYKDTVFNFHKVLLSKNEAEKEKIHRHLVELTGKIHVQMRRDLHVDDKSVFNEIK